eukprot:CAMPEP_0194533976 /NCGR_PEP_ID=MMETSP0253-20130528/71983_1 /TAXON_ID=2966 /ORGANISM="Noctiluca scintillans" /LENGTH=148 /DNA_ID=CAMNT_0039379579 /DNA_START=134 /DNA_END=580 /DNA_ORIENTATION=+
MTNVVEVGDVQQSPSDGPAEAAAKLHGEVHEKRYVALPAEEMDEVAHHIGQEEEQRVRARSLADAVHGTVCSREVRKESDEAHSLCDHVETWSDARGRGGGDEETDTSQYDVLPKLSDSDLGQDTEEQWHDGAQVDNPKHTFHGRADR